MFSFYFPYHSRESSKNTQTGTNNTHNNGNNDNSLRAANISEIKLMISRYNDAQMVLNEDLYGPLQNNSVIIVVQVSRFFCFVFHLKLVYLLILYVKFTFVDFCQSLSFLLCALKELGKCVSDVLIKYSECFSK